MRIAPEAEGSLSQFLASLVQDCLAPVLQRAMSDQAQPVAVEPMRADCISDVARPATSARVSGLIEYVYTEELPVRAHRLARMFRESCGAVLDVEDIIQAGAVHLLRRQEKALQARNPTAYLIHAAYFAMLEYCQEQRCAIRVPAGSQRHHGARVPAVLSLDAPLTEDGDLTLLDLIAL